MLQQLGYFIGCLDGETVPRELLAQYLQVVSGSKANPDAADQSYHCAFTFAAVVRTMGKTHWPALKALPLPVTTHVINKCYVYKYNKYIYIYNLYSYIIYTMSHIFYINDIYMIKSYLY